MNLVTDRSLRFNRQEPLSCPYARLRRRTRCHSTAVSERDHRPWSSNGMRRGGLYGALIKPSGDRGDHICPQCGAGYLPTPVSDEGFSLSDVAATITWPKFNDKRDRV